MSTILGRHARPTHASASSGPGAAPGPRADRRFFAASVVDGAVRTRGSATYLLGHRVRRDTGRSDDGVFAEWGWDGETLTATNDRYGMHPLFFCAARDAVWISPSIVALLGAGAPAELDFDALSVFLRLGFFLGDDTPFARIKALPPNARLAWRAGELRVGGGSFLRRPHELGRNTAIDGYIDSFRGAIRRRFPEDGDFVIPLSGGRDSRHILLELCEQGRMPKLCVTARHYPPHTNEDARVAALLAAAVGVPHVALEQPDRFDAERRKNVVTSFCADEHAWTLTVADFLGGRTHTMFDGIGGDVLSAGLFLNPERQALCEAGRFLDLAELLLPRSNDRTLSFCLRSDVRARVTRGHALGRIAAELEKHAEAANPIGSFFFWNRTRREIALVPFAVLGRVRRVFAPYLDHDLYDYLAALPARLLLDHRLHTDTILRAYPRYRDVPFEDKTLPRPSTWMLQRGFLRRLIPYARGRSGTPRALTRTTSPLIEFASFVHRFLDVPGLVQPELVLYLLQLQRLAAGNPDD